MSITKAEILIRVNANTQRGETDIDGMKQIIKIVRTK